jgi:hypothetical protein
MHISFMDHCLRQAEHGYHQHTMFHSYLSNSHAAPEHTIYQQLGYLFSRLATLVVDTRFHGAHTTPVPDPATVLRNGPIPFAFNAMQDTLHLQVMRNSLATVSAEIVSHLGVLHPDEDHLHLTPCLKQEMETFAQEMETFAQLILADMGCADHSQFKDALRVQLLLSHLEDTDKVDDSPVFSFPLTQPPL